jgi:PadR family transcriptional regulator PadR
MGPSQSNRRAKYYSLTARGKGQLEMERDQWDRMAAAIALVLNQAGSEAQ